MVNERFAPGDIDRVGARFREKGRMMPEDVQFVASWLEPSGDRCFQVMEAPSAEALEGWAMHWRDLTELEIVQVLSSADFWRTR
jgi:Protein of unknown function (DUF3303)